MTGSSALVVLKSLLANGDDLAAEVFLSGLIGLGAAPTQAEESPLERKRRADADRKRRQRERLKESSSGSESVTSHATSVTSHAQDGHATSVTSHAESVTSHACHVTSHATPHARGVFSFSGKGLVQEGDLVQDSQDHSSSKQVSLTLLDQAAVELTRAREATAVPSRRSGMALLDEPIFAEVKHELVERRSRGDEKRAARRKLAEVVFGYWQHRMGHGRALFDEKRQTRIMRRLEENGDDASELCYAVDGLFKSGWHRDNGHTGVEVVFRDREQVERFAATQGGYLRAEPHPHVAKIAGIVTLALAAGSAVLNREVAS